MREVPREWLVGGYKAAHDRFLEASQHPDKPEALHAAVLETLAWAVVLQPGDQRPTDPFLLAIRFARNRVMHQLADAVEARQVANPAQTPLRAGGGSRIVAPSTVVQWQWLESQDLPKPTERRYVDPVGEQHYDRLLAAKPVGEALNRLRQSL